MGIKQRAAVLGGGPCGLYAARVLSQQGVSAIVLDQGEKPGGLAGGHYFNGNWYDSGVHMFHAHDKTLFEDIKVIMGNERIEVPLNAKIRWAGHFYRYPLQFQDMIKGIPFYTLVRQVVGLLMAQLSHYFFPCTPENAEVALKQLYGKPNYEFFFKDFTHRYWGIHPSRLSATFITTKMPRLSAMDVIKRSLAKIGIKEKLSAVESALTEEILHYSRTGSETLPRSIVRTIERAGSEVVQQAKVVRVLTANSRVRQVVYQYNQQEYTVECDECISTIPITQLVAALVPSAPIEIIEAANQLRYKPITVYCLQVNKPKCLDALYVYYRDRIFHRVGEPKNGGLVVTPAHHTTLIVEMTCELHDEKWCGTEAVKQQIVEDLQAENICEPEDIVAVNVIRNETGYPIFSLGFEQPLATIKDYLSQFENLQTTGRQGGFLYPNMHTAMRMGADAAQKILSKRQTRAEQCVAEAKSYSLI